MPELAPLFAAIALSSLIILVSTSFTKMNKVYVQATLFAATIAVGLGYLITHQDPFLSVAWNGFLVLSKETKFCISLVLVGAIYFGGAMYIAAPDETDGVPAHGAAEAGDLHVYRTPASVDTSVTFEVPETLDEDDKVFFENMLDK